jgi:hypothetical protein
MVGMSLHRFCLVTIDERNHDQYSCTSRTQIESCIDMCTRIIIIIIIVILHTFSMLPIYFGNISRLSSIVVHIVHLSRLTSWNWILMANNVQYAIVCQSWPSKFIDSLFTTYEHEQMSCHLVMDYFNCKYHVVRSSVIFICNEYNGSISSCTDLSLKLSHLGNIVDRRTNQYVHVYCQRSRILPTNIICRLVRWEWTCRWWLDELFTS